MRADTDTARSASRSRREHVVVVGAGAAGMFAAIMLARAGVAVTLLDRDSTPLPASLAEVTHWARPAVPQSGHSHAFVARLRSLLLTHAPDLYDGLVAAGVREIRLRETAPATLLGTPPVDPDLVVLGARRPVLDWVFRRAAAAEPGVALRGGVKVAGLVVESSSGPAGRAPRVVGVRLADGTKLEADLVVDAGGRQSKWPAWLSQSGVTPPPPASVPCAIAYFSRFYRRADAAAPLPTALNRGHTVGSSFDRYSCLAFPADNDTFSVTFGVLPEDGALRVLRHGAGFDAAARSVPMIAPWLTEPGVTPLTPVAAMAGLNNVVRPWTGHDGRAVALNLLPVGDAAVVTNPAHTRGTTLALLSAVRLAAAVAATPLAEERSALLALSLATELVPWFDDSCGQDAARLARWRSPTSAPVVVPSDPTRVSNGEAFTASQRDPVVWHRFTRLQNLLADSESVLADPTVVARVRAVLASGWSPPRHPSSGGDAPSHDDLVGIGTEAARRAEAAAGAVG